MNAAGTSPMLQVRDLRKYFPVRGGLLRRVVANVRAVDGVSFTLERGRTFGLVGESGCGKSTLGRAIIRLHDPTDGEVVLDGENIANLDRQDLMPYRRRMQMIFQDPYASLSPRRTVAQTIREPLDVHRIGTPAEREEKVKMLLDVVGMSPRALNRYPHEFSGGQRQRVGIARALALNPELIVADEPVSALDVSVQSQILNLIEELQAAHDIAFLFIAHDLAVIQHVSDVIGVMYLGKLVEQASATDLYTDPKHPYTQALLSAVPVPDPKTRRKRIILEGEVPSPMNPPSGCPFHTRCPKVMDKCRQLAPDLERTGSAEPEHLVSCHLYD
ncbi:MAG: dipeptide ABC transporter ATP-binding protein [Gammaproteobacteria bacterium]|nr:dipeptide ABC transporter ATP-binding protein [Gammaproteobacteria bacterium]